MDNIDFAVLDRLDQLAARYGIKPYDFVATLDHSRIAGGMGLTFVVPAETSHEAASRVNAMLKGLGVRTDSRLGGGERHLIDVLDSALLNAPRTSVRHRN